MLRHLLAIAILTLPALARAAAPPAQPAAPVNCTDVQVGSAQSYDCLNAQLGAVARSTERPSSASDAPVSASSPDNVVGTFNEAGTRETLAHRPPPPNYPAPLPAPRPR